jgi:hypothetical protein
MKRSLANYAHYVCPAVILVLITFILWYEYNLWDECLDTNSFWYCLRVLGK